MVVSGIGQGIDIIELSLIILSIGIHIWAAVMILLSSGLLLSTIDLM